MPNKNSVVDLPEKGDEYRCTGCKLRIVVVHACDCDDFEEPHFQCCGEEMDKVP